MKKTPTSYDRSLLNSNDASAQTRRLQIVSLLNQHQSMNTPEFRERGTMAPAPRIFELRHEGHRIEKTLEQYKDETRTVHSNIAPYYFSYNSLANTSSYLGDTV